MLASHVSIQLSTLAPSPNTHTRSMDHRVSLIGYGRRLDINYPVILLGDMSLGAKLSLNDLNRANTWQRLPKL